MSGDEEEGGICRHALTQKTLITKANASLRQENIPTNPYKSDVFSPLRRKWTKLSTGVSAKIEPLQDAADASDRKGFFMDRKVA